MSTICNCQQAKACCSIIAALILLILPSKTKAEEGGSAFTIEADALTFFHDNEYDASALTNGYTLPGAWLRPTIQWDVSADTEATTAFHLELGVHALMLNGANKYPCYVYHDIGTWKGEQYQAGAHILPWVRAAMTIERWTIVVGDLYGADYHDYVTPLYNREQFYSADPEAGLQILYNSKPLTLDTYINWQSYQFQEDTHRETFTIGMLATAQPPAWDQFRAIVNLIAHHRGGQQASLVDSSVQTVWNSALGVIYTPDDWTLALNLLGCYQQWGDLWDITGGIALHAEAKYKWFTIGELYAPNNFISLLGNPYFSTVSLCDNTLHPKLSTTYLTAHYDRAIPNTSGNIRGGIYSNLYYTNATNLHELNFSFGVYIRATPRFKIK